MKLGIDLDKPNGLQLLKTYFNGRYFYGEPAIYKTKNGYHFEFNVETSIEARVGLKDDDKRIQLSEAREYLSSLDDVLFDWKWDGKWRKRERIDAKSLLCKPFWFIYNKRRWKKCIRHAYR